MKVFVAGATGVIGRALVPVLVKAGHEVVGVFVATDDVTSFLHVEDAAQAAVLALAWPRGLVNIVDDEPAPASVWGPVFAAAVGARPPEVSSLLRRRGVSNAKARHELAWQPIHPSWREGFGGLATADSEVRRSA